MPRLAVKKTAPVAVALPVAPVADEEPEEVAPVVPVVPEPEEVEETPYDEPSEDEEEDDPMTAMAKTQKQMLTEQMSKNKRKYLDLINGKVEEIEMKRDALKEQIRAYDEEIAKMKKDAHDKACEENKAVQQKLDKVLAFLGEAKTQRTAQRAERKASGEVVKAKTSTFFSRKPLNEMVNRDTRFIYEQKKGCVFKRFCLISKSENCVYECDENGTRNGVAFKSLNDFCVMVKKSVNYQGSLKQDTSVVLKYYDISCGEYKSFKDLTTALN